MQLSNAQCHILLISILYRDNLKQKFWYVCVLERVYFSYFECNYNIWYAHNKWCIRAGTQVVRRNTSSNAHVLACIPRPASSGMERMCQRHGSNQNFHPPALVKKKQKKKYVNNLYITTQAWNRYVETALIYEFLLNLKYLTVICHFD